MCCAWKLFEAGSTHRIAAAQSLSLGKSCNAECQLQGWTSVVAQRTKGRIRLQRLAATLLLNHLGVVPMSLSLSKTPDKALVLGVLMHWQTYCQVRLNTTEAVHESAVLCSGFPLQLCLHQGAGECCHLAYTRLRRRVTLRRSSRGTGPSCTRCTAGGQRHCRGLPSPHGIRPPQLHRRGQLRSGR